ncbi:hypothetical protein MHM84_01285 [Halomonas sp. McH1-25]|uniref:hypothetical protein n=1 Tax=unclassified Halomonas TaxID=2609666 RepID=UPI001EF47022|nr:MULTISPECIES: hypothetical protein [unclassified Halomonas]MCG7598415.1 hypothetical protein [Halomonas sp. McH1-25]MCP1343751.1 hypothetical protein [Halomonas sp. FL8]MCP1361730.1 hypothetical protein [Halomonas sp. BBD45]MCP1365183.1 hypothetical protein [Halomonas sp. BBD48]
MAGLLGAVMGAIGGAGEAVQTNAKLELQKRKEEALLGVRHKYSMAEQKDQQQFTAQENTANRTFQRGERIAGQEFTAGENQANRQHDTRLTQMREGGANSRLNARLSADREQGRNDWQLVPMEGGGYTQYSPTRNEYRDANLPEGAKLDATTDLSERQTYQLDAIQNRMEAIREAASNNMRDLTTEEKTELGRLKGQYEAILGSGGGGQTILEQLTQGEGGGLTEPSAQPADSVPGIIQRERQVQQSTQASNEAAREANAARETADRLLEKIEQEKGGGATGGLLRSINQARGQGSISEATIAEAQRVADQLVELGRNENLSADEKRWLAERIMQLQDAGVPININQ